MKSPLRLLVGAVISWCGITAVALAQTKSDAPLPNHHQLNRLGLERVWWAQAVLNPHRDKVRSIAIDEDVLVVQSTSGVATGLDAETGQQLWASQLGNQDQQSYPAVSSESLSLIVYGDTLYALNKQNGRMVWTLILPGQPSTGPALDDKRVYIGCLDGSLYAYSLRVIRKLYEERRLPQWSNEAQLWKYKAAKEITSPAIPAGRNVYVASRDGSLYAVTTANRKLTFQLETDKSIVAPLTRAGDMMYVASEDNSFYAINTMKQKVIWEFTSGLPIRKAPWPFEKDLYVLPDRGGMYNLDPANGNTNWWQPQVTDFIAMLGNTVVASDRDGNLLMISRDKGEVTGQLPFRRYTIRPGNDRTDRIYLATESGLLVCLRQIGHTFPRYHRYPDRLPLLPMMESEEGEQAKPSSEPSEDK